MILIDFQYIPKRFYTNKTFSQPCKHNKLNYNALRKNHGKYLKLLLHKNQKYLFYAPIHENHPWFLILSLLTFSCKEKNEPQNKQEKITKSPIEVNVINQNTVKRNILNQVRSFEFLALKGIPVDKSILKVNKAIEYNGKLLLLDKMRSNLHLFTLDGDFIKIIGVKGDGPEEFKSIKDFSVHKNRNEIIIIDHESMLIYDLNGNFKNKVYLGSNPIP